MKSSFITAKKIATEFDAFYGLSLPLSIVSRHGVFNEVCPYLLRPTPVLGNLISLIYLILPTVSCKYFISVMSTVFVDYHLICVVVFKSNNNTLYDT